MAIGSLKSDLITERLVDCLRSMLIHQETIKESLEADPPCSPDSWTDQCLYVCVCVCITSLLPCEFAAKLQDPCFVVKLLLLLEQGVKSPPCTCGSLIAGIWLQSSNCFNRCCRAVILNKRYFISRGYLHRLQEVRGNATKLSLFGQNKNGSTYLSFRVTNLLGANFSIFIISLSRSTAQHTHVLST